MKNVILACSLVYLIFICARLHESRDQNYQGPDFTRISAEPGDIIICEIMADPTPAVYLPEKEFIEITSGAGLPLSLEGWYLLSGNTKYNFPPVQIHAGEFIILCHVSDTQLFSGYGRCAGFKTFPALTDGGKDILIYDKNGRMIHGVEYSPLWYGDDLKSGGGWSMEMTDTAFPFHYDGNWKASVSATGGTPGRRNSVSAKNPDNLFAGLTNAFPVDSATLKVRFSEPVKVLESVSGNIRINEIPVRSVSESDPLRREFLLHTSSPLGRGIIYSLALPGNITDYAGNRALTITALFGRPEEPMPGEIQFNELLFNPLPGDADYIELVNNSGKIFNAVDVSVSSKNQGTGKISAPVPASAENRCIMPGDYYAITSDRSATVIRYFSSRADKVFQVNKMPSMPDDGGTLILYNRRLETLDEVTYTDRHHNIFMSGSEGVSLEKINPTARSSFPGNWHSASEASGWGTPGERNSVFYIFQPSGKPISLSSTRISPDNDGYEDVLLIRFRPEGAGNVTNVTIFDEAGFQVRKVATNYFIGAGGDLMWNGTSDDGSHVPAGIYVILVTMFNDKGRAESWKMACAVVKK